MVENNIYKGRQEEGGSVCGGQAEPSCSFVFLKGHRFQGSKNTVSTGTWRQHSAGLRSEWFCHCVCQKVHGWWAHLLTEKVGAAGQAG